MVQPYTKRFPALFYSADFRALSVYPMDRQGEVENENTKEFNIAYRI